jgi:hypothetical protein
METPHAKKIHEDNQGVEPGPPYPIARVPHDVSTGIRRWPMHYPDFILEVW